MSGSIIIPKMIPRNKGEALVKMLRNNTQLLLKLLHNYCHSSPKLLFFFNLITRAEKDTQMSSVYFFKMSVMIIQVS